MDNKISEKDFAETLILYAGLPEAKRIKMIKRVKKKYKESLVSRHRSEIMLKNNVSNQFFFFNQGITFEEYLDFYEVLKFINDIDTALMFYHVAGASIDKGNI